MSSRKKSSKSQPIKHKQTQERVQDNSLTAILLKRAIQSNDTNTHGNLTAAILETLISGDQTQLKQILISQSLTNQQIRSIVQKMVTSKVSLFVTKVLQICRTQEFNQYVYPWLLQTYLQHSQLLNQEIVAEMKKIIPNKQGELSWLLGVEGKLDLIDF